MLKQKSTYQKMLSAFLPFFVLIEVYRGLAGDTLSLGPFALEEIAVALYALILFFAGAGFAWKEGRKKLLALVFGYFALAALYAVVHSLHAARFDPAFFPAAQPSFAVETYAFLRQYVLPGAVFAAALFLGVPKKEFRDGARLAAFLAAFFIVATDLFGLSFAAYANGRVRVEGGFFRWFELSEGARFDLYTAKGPFLIHNVMGAFLFALTPFSFLALWKEKKWTDVLSLAVQMLAMLMLGTKVASFGFLATLLSFGAVFSAQAVQHRGLQSVRLPLTASLVLTSIFLPLYFISPGYRWQQVRREDLYVDQREAVHAEEIEKEIASGTEDLSPEKIDELERYLNKYFYEHYLARENTEIYPVRTDPEFWIRVLERDNTLNRSYRSFKLEMAERVKERRGNGTDVLLGLGATANLPYTERDFADQYEVYGLAGLALILLPFFAAGALGAARYLRCLRKKRPAAFCGTLLFSLAALAGTGVAAGHVLGSLLNTYVSFLFAGVLLEKVLETGNQD